MKLHNNNGKCFSIQKKLPAISSRMALFFIIFTFTIFCVANSVAFSSKLGKPAYLNIPKWQICTDEAKPSPREHKIFY